MQVHTVAQLVHLRRCLGTEAALRREFKTVARHVGVAIDLERPVGAATQAHRRALEVAHRGIKVYCEHIGQIGARSDGQRVACLVGIVLARDDSEVHFFAVLEPAFSVCHLCQFAQRHAMHGGDGEASYARLECHVQDGTIDIHAVGVGPVEHHELLAIGHCGIHQVDHRYIVGVEPQAYVLNIGHDDVDTVHHFTARHR